jgi:hypothetical protein
MLERTPLPLLKDYNILVVLKEDRGDEFMQGYP